MVTIAEQHILENLRAMREQLEAIQHDVRNLKSRVNKLELGQAAMINSLKDQSGRFDRLEDRLERIEERLDLTES